MTLQYQKDGSGNKGDDTAYLIIKINGEEYVFNDGTKGTFNGSLNGLNATVVSTGTGKLSVDGVEVDYVLNEGKLNFILNNSMKVITVADGAFTQVQDGYAGEYTMPDGSKINLDGLGGVTDTNKTYVIDGTQITIYDGDTAINYGIDVDNKVFLSKSAFAGLIYQGKHYNNWDEGEANVVITFDDSSSITGTLTFKGQYSNVTFTFISGTVESGVLTLKDSSDKTLVFQLSNENKTMKVLSSSTAVSSSGFDAVGATLNLVQ